MREGAAWFGEWKNKESRTSYTKKLFGYLRTRTEGHISIPFIHYTSRLHFKARARCFKTEEGIRAERRHFTPHPSCSPRWPNYVSLLDGFWSYLVYHVSTAT